VNGVCCAAAVSYEECSSIGPVDIHEEDDNQYIHGDLRWCPRYPMYQQASDQQGPGDPPLGPAQLLFPQTGVMTGRRSSLQRTVQRS